MGQLSGWTGLILLLVILLLFAAPKLPQLAKSLGQSASIFKKEIKAGRESDAEGAAAPEGTTTSAPATGTTTSSGEGTDSTPPK